MEKVYLTNNICLSIQSHISKFIGNKNVSKGLFKETLNFIINQYKYNIKNCLRKDFITRTLIIIIEKYGLNNTPQFIKYEIFKKELDYTISIITGNIKLNAIYNIFCL